MNGGWFCGGIVNRKFPKMPHADIIVLCCKDYQGKFHSQIARPEEALILAQAWLAPASYWLDNFEPYDDWYHKNEVKDEKASDKK